jgi:hypothetical protein
MLSRGQVKRWLFDGLSEPIVTRCIERLAERHYLGVERLHGNGIQVLWLTREGKEFLIGQGTSAADLFSAVGPVAAKDFEHTMAIGDVAAWIARKVPSPTELLPAWAVQRFFGGMAKAVPDLLAVWRDSGAAPTAAMIIEVDLGTEPVRTVLRAKLNALDRFAKEFFGDSEVAMAMFVDSERRRESVRKLSHDLEVNLDVRLLDEIAKSLKPANSRC